MGRDDAHRVSGLQGGRAPARAFAQYMQVAVARRPVEQFDSELTLPEWQLEPDNEAYFGEPDNGMYVDENGMPLESEPGTETRSEEHTSELQSLMRNSYAVFCLKKKQKIKQI